MAVMRRLLLLSLLLQLTHCSCRPGFELFRNGQCAGFYTSMSIGDDQAVNTAINKCKEIQGKPVIIHDDVDQQYWASATGGKRTLIGLVCNSNSQRWEWSDGTTVNYKPPSSSPCLNDNCKAGCAWFMSAGPFWDVWCDKNFESFDIRCTVQLSQPVPSTDGCESFEDDNDDGLCYQVGVPAENWQEAQMICRSFGADVASIHNEKENAFVRRIAVSKGALGGLFLGATKSGKGNEFGWIDGSDWDYDNFYQGFPMNGLGDCIVMDTDGTSGQWANVDCASQLSVACMRQQHYSDPGCLPGPWKEGQIIYSPGFPFDAKTSCDYLLQVDAGKRVEAEVLLLEANICSDRLVLMENYFGGNVVANLTGEISDQKYSTNSSNFMRVSWLPNGGVGVRGFMMTFRGV